MTKSVSRLIAQFAPKSYDLYLDPQSESMTFSGTVRIVGLKVGRPSKRITFHQNGLKVLSASITKHEKKSPRNFEVTRINHHKNYFEVRLHTSETLYPGEYTIELSFEGAITEDMNGIYPCYFKHGDQKQKLIMTQFESHYAREVFPCIDEPEAKATFDLTLRHPKEHTALANTQIKMQKEEGDHLISTFESTPRMSTYLLAFVIGKLHGIHTKTNSGVEIGVWGTIAQPKNSFDFALDAAKRSIEFFENYFNTPYPLPKADYVAVPDFSAGAMENWGLMTYREVALLTYPEETSPSAKELIALVVAHETAHMWFGDLVTMKWWDELWLNESFANMMEYRCVDALFPEWGIWNTFYAHEGLSALRRDSIFGVQPVRQDVNHPDEINTIFDPSIVYAKGGRLLYMLMNFIGEEAFRTGLTQYFETFAYKNTSGENLWEALAASSGEQISNFMNPWLERSGYPVVTVSQEGAYASISQEQFLDARDKVDTSRLWPLPLFSKNPNIPRVLSQKSLECTLENDEFIFLNEGGAGHYLVHYTNAAHVKELSARVKNGQMGEIDRLMLLNTSSMLAKARYGSFSEALELLQSFTDESSENVWDIISVLIGDAKRFIDHDSRIEKSIKAMVRDLVPKQYARLGWDEVVGESSSDAKLRATIIGLAAYADVNEVTQKAIELFERYPNNPHEINGELRSIVFSVAVKNDVDGAVDYLLGLHHSTQSSDMKRDIASALTTTRSADVATRLLSLLPNSDLIKPQDADRWLAQLLHNRYTKHAAWQWMVDNWGWIEETYGRDKSFDYMPRYSSSICNTIEWQDKFNSFFADKLDNPILRRNILIGKEEIAARVAWLESDVSSVRAFFNISD